MIVAGLGVKFYMDEEKLNEEMMNVIYSDEAKVHSYEIVKESIRRNPMGGINVEIIINNDSEMSIEYTMDKFNGQLRCGGASISQKLAKLLGIWK